MSEEQHSPETPETAPLHGVLAEYNTPGEILEAARVVRDAGYTKWDTYTPFPVHGIDAAMGIKMTRLPWIVLCAALTGLTTAILLQWWTNVVDYPFVISGKPMWSIPANVPVMFELTVLFSAFATLGGMLVLNNLPLPSHPLDLKERFAKSTDDKFFLLITAADPAFDEKDTRELLESTHPAVLDDVPEDRQTPDKLPRIFVYGMIILTVAALVPFALFAKARETQTRDRRLHAIWDMDFQPKYKAQRENPLFEDRRAMRLPLDGTVAVGQLKTDDHLNKGKVDGVFARTFPREITASTETIERGQERFGIYCAPCHGYSGAGDGMVHKRAAALQEAGVAGSWVPPTNLQQQTLYEQPVGQLFDSITNGVRNMPGYGHAVSTEDRWAIVMYLRALQRMRVASLGDLTPEERSALK